AVLDLAPRLGEASDLAAAVDQIKAAARVVGTELVKAWASEEQYKQIKDALAAFRTELLNRLQFFLNPPDNAEVAVVIGQRFLRVTEQAVLAYGRLKHRHGVVDFQDLLIGARDLLRDHARVRELLQQRYRFLLIDELQDTDPVQMELVAL